VNIWSETGEANYECESAYGTGACLEASGTKSYAAIVTSYTQPPAYTTPPTMSGELATGFATNISIPMPTIPQTFYPGLPQITPLAKNL
jgi:rhamnogalacturonan hydrolase